MKQQVQASIPSKIIQLNEAQTSVLTETVTITPTATITPTPFIVTPTATARDIFEAATRLAELTSEATPTPLPDNAIVATLTPTLTPWVVTDTPTPANAETQAVAWLIATLNAKTTGTATLLPPNMVTPVIVLATATPKDIFEIATRRAEFLTATPIALPINVWVATNTPTVWIVTSTPTAENEATAEWMIAQETAQAFTTGTPLPFVTATATPVPPVPPTATHTPVPTATPIPTATPTLTHTPFAIPLADLPPTPTVGAVPTALFPAALYGKILFLGDFDASGGPEGYVINTDGSGIARLTSLEFYKRAKQREAFSSDQSFRAFSLAEGGNGQSGLVQIFYQAIAGSQPHQLTFFGAGTAWLPAWSSTEDRLAFVSNENGNEEIWAVYRDQWPAVQLTHNQWEWDQHPSWSPDGTQIVFGSNRVTGKRQVWIMNADGGNQRPFTNFSFETWDPVWVKYLDQ